MSALSDLLNAANTDALSTRKIAALARESGHSINHDTVARYLRGVHGTPDEATLRAFADVFGIGLRDLRAAADLPSEAVEPYTPPDEASRLSRRQRKAVDELIRSMVEPVRAAGPPAAAPGLRAARHGEPEATD